MIVVDTSAILAILQREPEAPRFRRAIAEAGVALVSAGTAVELAAMVTARPGSLREEAKDFLRLPFVRIEPVTAAQADRAADGFSSWGKGHHPAGLNFGDMFAYLLARDRGLPLLFKGNDFVHTEVESALAGEGSGRGD